MSFIFRVVASFSLAPSRLAYAGLVTMVGLIVLPSHKKDVPLLLRPWALFSPFLSFFTTRILSFSDVWTDKGIAFDYRGAGRQFNQSGIHRL